MEKQEEWYRQRAIKRLARGEKAQAICASLGRTKPWFYKWLARSRGGDPHWYQDQSRRPFQTPSRTPDEIVEIVKFVRLELYNQGVFCGAQAIRWRMEELQVQPLPSLRTIARILVRHSLTHRRTGRYEPKGKRYPALDASHPGSVHQSDFVGPCYLHGPVRFYSFNTVDLATGRCGVEPVLRGKDTVVDAVWATWLRLGLPHYLQVDNEAVFYGSPTHPRGMGKLIRLCLPLGIEPCFIPLSEPWRNGVVERFNDHWREKFLGRVVMKSEEDVKRESLAFEQRHNHGCRYSKLNGKTPIEALAASNKPLRFPQCENPPKLPLPKPETGYYHVVRLIRSDARFNLFGEAFRMPPEAVYEYVWATVDVGRQRLCLYLDGRLLDELEYRVR
ncbi:MAG TPA: integrase core domain-containing protein [Thermotogota bacterium]|nr:integrase core domain-containing protein [Thermotogota bacterium]